MEYIVAICGGCALAGALVAVLLMIAAVWAQARLARAAKEE